MNKQTQFKATLTMLNIVVKAYASGACKEYWESVLDKADSLTIKEGAKGGDVQSTLSNPLAYYAVPIYEHNCFNAGLRSTKPKGRDVDFTMAQFVRAIKGGQTNRADKIARLASDVTIDELTAVKAMVDAGYAICTLKRTSANKEIRQGFNKQSQLARQLRAVPEISADIAEEELEQL